MTRRILPYRPIRERDLEPVVRLPHQVQAHRLVGAPRRDIGELAVDKDVGRTLRARGGDYVRAVPGRAGDL